MQAKRGKKSRIVEASQKNIDQIISCINHVLIIIEFSISFITKKIVMVHYFVLYVINNYKSADIKIDEF